MDAERLSALNTAWWREKAEAFAAAWRDVYSVYPSNHATALGLAVAAHETACGDDWPGEHNWGAVQKRRLTPSEALILEGNGWVSELRASWGDARRREKTVAGAREALAGKGYPPGFDESLHADSSPVTGPYFTYFWSFPNDVDGAMRFVEVLALERPLCRAVLTSTEGGPPDLARAMYASHYYEGVHDPHTEAGRDSNIKDYEDAITPLFSKATANLVGWSPGSVVEPAPDFNFGTTAGVQEALNYLGTSPRLVVDGKFGPKTRAAVLGFQEGHQLMGQMGNLTNDTIEALRIAVTSFR